MGNISKEAILSKTHYGIGIYAHILRLYYPGETVLSLSGRTCSPAKNPFNADKPTLNIFIYKEKTLSNALDKELAQHYDEENAIPIGDAFDFAELYYKLSGDELLQTINKDMHLRIKEKFDFCKSRNVNIQIAVPSVQKVPESHNQDNHNNRIDHGSDIGGVLFSFFKAPVRNIIPHKSISLLDAYNYIVGDYAKARTEKLRSIKDPKQARQYKTTNFDYCTFSGVFTARNDKVLIKHSGLLCVDFDHLPKVDHIRHQLLQDEYFETQMLFGSPSGDGLKWIISIDTTKASHGDFFAAVANYILQTYGVPVDKSGRDISRACFLPHDPQAFINPIYLK